MTTVHVHYRGLSAERLDVPVVPRPGDFLDHGGRLWRVEAVLLVEGEAVHVYLVEVAGQRAAELRRAWATWDQAGQEPAPQPTGDSR